MPAGGSIRRLRNLRLQATSRRSDVLQPTTTTSSRRVVALTFVTRTTSRRPVASIPPQARVDNLLRGVCGTRSMRSPVEIAYPGFRKFVHVPRMTDISADGRYGSGVVEGHGIGSRGTIRVRRQRDAVRPGHGHRAPLHLKDGSVSSSPTRADRGPGRPCGRYQPSRSRELTSTLATGFDRNEDRPLDRGGGPSARRRYASHGKALGASAGGASCGASLARAQAAPRASTHSTRLVCPRRTSTPFFTSARRSRCRLRRGMPRTRS